MTITVDSAIIEIDQFGRTKKEVIYIYTHFQTLDKEKKKRILNAAFREFGKYGYRKTSTEQLAKNAGIAKGMLFHYFGSKQRLFEYLFEYAGGLMNSWWGHLDQELSELDFIEQYRRVTKIKLRAYTENPYVFEFFTMLFTHPENLEISAKTNNIYSTTMQMRSNALALIASSKNTTLFRDDIDVDKAKRYIGWLIEGYSSHILTDFGSKPLVDIEIDSYWEEFDEILDDCRTIFYKSE